MKGRRLSLLALALLAITLIVGCAGKETAGHRFEVVEENGIALALTTGGPRHPENIFTLRPLLTLREDPWREESILFDT